MDATSSAAVVAQMADAAEAFLGTLDEAGRVAATGRLGGDYRQWTYLPGPRPGLCLADMSVEQRDTALALLDAGCSAGGAKTARAVIGLDMIHRQLVADPDLEDHQFWVRVLGDPTGEQPWAWRVNGHHLAVHVVAVAGRSRPPPVSTAPTRRRCRAGRTGAPHPFRRGGPCPAPARRPGWPAADSGDHLGSGARPTSEPGSTRLPTRPSSIEGWLTAT